jgi:hypothetical protein
MGRSPVLPSEPCSPEAVQLNLHPESSERGGAGRVALVSGAISAAEQHAVANSRPSSGVRGSAVFWNRSGLR